MKFEILQNPQFVITETEYLPEDEIFILTIKSRYNNPFQEHMCVPQEILYSYLADFYNMDEFLTLSSEGVTEIPLEDLLTEISEKPDFQCVMNQIVQRDFGIKAPDVATFKEMPLMVRLQSMIYCITELEMMDLPLWYVELSFIAKDPLKFGPESNLPQWIIEFGFFAHQLIYKKTDILDIFYDGDKLVYLRQADLLYNAINCTKLDILENVKGLSFSPDKKYVKYYGEWQAVQDVEISGADLIIFANKQIIVNDK